MHAVVSKGKKQHEKNTWTVVGMWKIGLDGVPIAERRHKDPQPHEAQDIREKGEFNE
jgi:hypothetical protein